MSIPKVIHYCWYGGNDYPELTKACIESWKKFCPDYEIIEWNESNSDFSDCAYAMEAYEHKRWAFVTDYMRSKIIYENGGIYLDTDVMLVKNLDSLLEHKAFAGWEEGGVNTGLGFGAEKGNPIVKEFMDDYRGRSFIGDDGEVNYIIVPALTTETFRKHGMQNRDDIIQQIDSFTIFPREYFCPLDIRIDKMNITENTYSIHYYSASWYDEEQKKARATLTKKRKMQKLLGDRLFKVWDFGYNFFCQGGLKDFLKSRSNK